MFITLARQTERLPAFSAIHRVSAQSAGSRSGSFFDVLRSTNILQVTMNNMPIPGVPSSVGAVYDRTYFVDYRQDARS